MKKILLILLLIPTIVQAEELGLICDGETKEYDSISKKGKRSKFNHSRLKKAFKTKKNYEVYAGGGITASRIAHCQELGFDGVVVMGSIWESEDPIASFGECLNVCNKLASDGKVE